MIVKELGISFLIMFFSASCAFAASRERDVRIGNSFYEQGQYKDSLEKYLQALKKDPESAIINFDTGTAYYKNKEYGKATEYLKMALLSDDENLKRDAYYNLGNSLYHQGILQKEADVNTAVAFLEKALVQYESGLSIDREDEDAKFNYEFVKKVLEKLKKKQQEQQNKQCPLKDKKDKKDKKDNKGQDKKDSGSDEKKDSGQEKRQNDDQGQEQRQQGDPKGKDEKENLMKPQAGQEQEQEQKETQQKASAQREVKAMTKQEAAMMLNDYQQNEEPKELFDFIKRIGDMNPVERDW